jgi:hypothetical protein
MLANLILFDSKYNVKHNLLYNWHGVFGTNLKINPLVWLKQPNKYIKDKDREITSMNATIFLT